MSLITNNLDQRTNNDSFSWGCFTVTLISSQCQTGVQDYEIFNGQLDLLGSWIVEAEDALKVQDPNGSTEPTVVQDRMEELKVFFVPFHVSSIDFKKKKKTPNPAYMSLSRNLCWNSAVWLLN